MKQMTGIAALAFLSLVLFGGGIFLHCSPPKPSAQAAQVKSVSHVRSGKSKAAPKAAAPKPGSSAENSLAFPALVAGELGLLLSALMGLGLCYSQTVSQPQAAKRLREAQEAARQKQQGDFEAQQAALQSQLLEAKQRKAETESLRDQVSRQFQEFFRTLPVPCFCFAANGRIIRWNAACETLYGIPAAAALESMLWDTIVPVSEREEVEAKISRVLAGESLLTMERWDTVAGGGLSKLQCSIVPLYDAEGLIIGGLSAGVEVPELAQYEQQIAALNTELEAAQRVVEPAETAVEQPAEGAAAASADVSGPELSGHPAFRTRLTEEIDRAARYHSPLSLVVLDLDSFAARNRSFGFDAGDQALQAVVTVIKSKIRTVDVLTRLGADEYAVILPETGEAGARVAAERLRTGIAGTSIRNQPPLTACFGVTQLTPEVSGAEVLVNRALEALESARSAGMDTVVHYQDLPEGGLANRASLTPARQSKLR